MTADPPRRQLQLELELVRACVGAYVRPRMHVWVCAREYVAKQGQRRFGVARRT